MSPGTNTPLVVVSVIVALFAIFFVSLGAFIGLKEPMLKGRGKVWLYIGYALAVVAAGLFGIAVLG
jgi:hypothetical protein